MKTRAELYDAITEVIAATPAGTEPWALATLIMDVLVDAPGVEGTGTEAPAADQRHTVLSLTPRDGGRPVRPRLLVNGVAARGLVSARVRSRVGDGTTAKLVFAIADRACFLEGFAGVVDTPSEPAEDWRKRARPRDWSGWFRK